MGTTFVINKYEAPRWQKIWIYCSIYKCGCSKSLPDLCAQRRLSFLYIDIFQREGSALFSVFSTYCVLVFKSFTILSLTDQQNQVEIRRALLEYLLNLPQIDNESIVEETGGESKILRAVKRNMECPSSQAPLNTRQLIHK